MPGSAPPAARDLLGETVSGGNGAFAAAVLVGGILLFLGRVAGIA